MKPTGWVDTKHDLAILQATSGTPFSKVLSIGKHQPPIGSTVHLIIGPTGGEKDGECSSEKGFVTAPHKSFKGTFAVDPPIFIGESGTGVVNYDGKLVGVAVAAGAGRIAAEGPKNYLKSLQLYYCTAVSLIHVQNIIGKKFCKMMSLPVQVRELPAWKIN